MLKKLAHVLVAALFHVAVLLTAHHLAEHIGFEVAGLVRDEWLLGAFDRAVTLVSAR